jgi:hypothetical protein
MTVRESKIHLQSRDKCCSGASADAKFESKLPRPAHLFPTFVVNRLEAGPLPFNGAVSVS